jgi:hypothetical protein
LSEEIKNDIISMQPVFDYTPIKTLNVFSLLGIQNHMVNKKRIGAELEKMLSNRIIGLRSIELMTDLGVLDNFVT